MGRHRPGVEPVEEPACLARRRPGSKPGLRKAVHRAGHARSIGTVICRLWHGWTAPTSADDYERYLRDELYPRLEGADGYRGHHVLRRPDGDEVEFVTLTWFDSLDAVRAFAGDDYETPVITERAAALLVRWADKAVHYDLALQR